MPKKTCADCGKELGFMGGYKDKKDIVCRDCFIKRREQKQIKKVEERTQQIQSAAILFNDQMTDDEIKQKIRDDMARSAAMEAKLLSMYGSLASLGDPVVGVIGGGLFALIIQNKLLIKQNELILRKLSEKA